MKITPMLAGFVGVLAVVSVACGGDGDSVTAPTQTVESAPLAAIDPDSALIVEGRDRLTVCVEVIGEPMLLEDAVARVESALSELSGRPQWLDDYGQPRVDSGCPLPPVPLDQGPVEKMGNMECAETVSRYLYYVFVADEASLGPAFPGAGLRQVAQEGLQQGHNCAAVAEAWYVTPDELTADGLAPYVFSHGIQQ